MNKTVIGVIYVIVMIGVIVAIDFLFLRHNPDIRLAANIGLVVAFGALYLLVVRRL